MSRGGRGGLRERGGGGEGLRVPRGGLSIFGDMELVVDVDVGGEEEGLRIVHRHITSNARTD